MQGVLVRGLVQRSVVRGTHLVKALAVGFLCSAALAASVFILAHQVGQFGHTTLLATRIELIFHAVATGRVEAALSRELRVVCVVQTHDWLVVHIY